MIYITIWCVSLISGLKLNNIDPLQTLKQNQEFSKLDGIDFEDMAAFVSKQLSRSVSADQVQSVIDVQLKGLEIISIEDPTHPFLGNHIRGFGGGGCWAALAFNGYMSKLHLLTGNNHNTRAAVGASGGAWSLAFFNNHLEDDNEKTFGDCSPFTLGKTRAEIAENMLTCIGCKGLSYEECNKHDETALKMRVLGPLSTCVLNKKHLDPGLQHMCTVKNGCNVHNVHMAYIDDLFREDAGVGEFHGRQNYTYLFPSSEHLNRFGQRGLDSLKSARNPKIFKFEENDSGDGFKDALGHTSNFLVALLVDIIWVIESGLCGLSAKEGQNKKASFITKEIMTRFFGPADEDAYLRSQIHSLMEQTIKQTSFQKIHHKADLNLPSPLLTALWSFLPHEEGSFFKPVLSDGAEMDPTGFLTGLQFLDSQPDLHQNGREPHFTIFDTSAHGYTWTKDSAMKETHLYMGAIQVLEQLNMTCDHSVRVPSPNGVFDNMWYGGGGVNSKDETEVLGALFDYMLDYKQNVTLPEWYLQLLLYSRATIGSNDFWDIKGGYEIILTYFTLANSYYDDWLLDLLPEDYKAGLVAKGYPEVSLEWTGSIPFADAFFGRVSGEMRAFFFACLWHYKFNPATKTTPECHAGGQAWENPMKFISEFRGNFKETLWM